MLWRKNWGAINNKYFFASTCLCSSGLWNTLRRKCIYIIYSYIFLRCSGLSWFLDNLTRIQRFQFPQFLCSINATASFWVFFYVDYIFAYLFVSLITLPKIKKDNNKHIPFCVHLQRLCPICIYLKMKRKRYFLVKNEQ